MENDTQNIKIQIYFFHDYLQFEGPLCPKF
jgi:hypothetical protein